MSCYFLIWPESTAVADNELRMIIFFSTNKSNIKNDYVAEDVFFFFFCNYADITVRKNIPNDHRESLRSQSWQFAADFGTIINEINPLCCKKRTS